MKLPLSDEIRAARAAVDGSQAALRVKQRLTAARTAMSIVEAQHQRRLPVPQELPGEDLILELASTFRELAELPSVCRPTDPMGVRLKARVQQLELASQAIGPLVEAAEADAGLLHELQHRQHHMLERPEWAAAVAELAELGARRDEIAVRMAPLRHQLALVGPVREMLLGFHPQLQEELVLAARTEDPHGLVAWRAAVMAHNQLVGLAGVIQQLGLSILLPVEPAIPDAPHPRHRRRLRKEAGEVLEWMVTLSSALADHGEVLAGIMDAEQAALDAAETALRERMG
jgi:hypothetical protein